MPQFNTEGLFNTKKEQAERHLAVDLYHLYGSVSF